ncbi:sulfotransferase [Xanthomonas nasturtii]|uniref:sulfotransferase family protein n=1 Tax=Xanthomonas nasturtii TaxID=1843581 RepID=UPI002011776C|nr:sulfotransferase [Xanthomonas nasturtii]MCL1581248.1 sulfotransferase [Xanthomonas nasturtii]MCL1590909.1 sulfotransferase [Xanthomonas nasturtii]
MVTLLSDHKERMRTWIRDEVVPDLSSIAAWSRFAEELHNGNLLLDACHAYWHLASLRPGEPAYLINIGNLLLELEDFSGSLAAFEEAVRRGAGDEVACQLGKGLALLYLQKYQQAERSLRYAWQQEPEACDVVLAYSQCLMELERFDEMKSCLSHLEHCGMSRAQRESFAWLLANCGEEQRALALYKDLLDDAHSTSELRIQLVLLLERLNRLEEAEGHLQHKSVTAGEISPMKALALGRLLRRQKKYEDAEKCLASGIAMVGGGAIGALLEFERAKNADAGSRYDEAMAALNRAHVRAVAAYNQRIPEQEADNALRWLEESLKKPVPLAWNDLRKGERSGDPTFLVGFPRSGTTLLERILDAHPGFAVLDERPALEEAIASLRSSKPFAEPQLDDWLAALSDDQISRARDFYYAVAARYISIKPGLVDKYPLNLTRVPYISRIFPRAKYIFLLRDPHDCVLSCYMQAFGMRGGALSFATLEGSAETYVEVMSHWERHRALANANVYELRYEDLVKNMPAHVSALLDFLESEWDDVMANFQELARLRSTRINTPSYAQVIEPINDRAIGRWENYRHHFSQRTLSLLAPWRRRYGYA